MGKKYLSIEEAAALLGTDPKELNRRREKGEIRAFADRGTWKFREDDIQELSRQQRPDSDPEVPLAPLDSDLNETLFFDEKPSGGPSSAINLGSDEERLSEQPTIIRRNPLDARASDSDVRLVFDEDLLSASSGEISKVKSGDSDSDVRLSPQTSGSDSDVKMVGSNFDVPVTGASQSDVEAVRTDHDITLHAGSDSDIKLVGDEFELDFPEPKADSDSDVKLLKPKGKDSASDVKLFGQKDAGSDSDVKLVGQKKKKGSDSDVKLVSPGGVVSESDVTVFNPDEAFDDDIGLADVKPIEGGSFVLGGEDSGISLGSPSDSGIALEQAPGGSSLRIGAGESGIMLVGSGSLGGGDSGITLDDGDSGITLADDSGLTLTPGDSGIALLGPEDSGIALAGPADSGIALERTIADDDLGGTIPMIAGGLVGKDDHLGATQMEVPLLGGEEDSFEFSNKGLDSDDDTATNVIMLDDEEEADDYAATQIKKKKKPAADEDEDLLDDSVFDVQEDDDVVSDDDDVEVSADIEGEDDEVDAAEDVFGADDEDFSEDDDAAPAAYPAARGVAAPVEQEWGAGVFAGLALSSVLMLCAFVVMYDGVRTMWEGGDPSAFSGFLMTQIRGMFG